MFSRRGLISATAGLVLVASLSAIAGPASAATVPGVLTFVMPADAVVTQPDGERPLVGVDLVLQAGESRRLIGLVQATMNTTAQANMDDTTTLRCLNASGAQAGIAATAEAGLLPLQTRALRPTMLFTPGPAGAYHCYLAAQTGSTNGPSMTVHKDQTYLKVSAGDETGAHMWHNPPCDSAGTLASCTYLGESGGPTQRFLLDNDGSVNNDGSSPLAPWRAADNATSIAVTANVELTECGHTASCGGRRHDGDSATVSSHVEAVQLDAQGNACRVTRSDDQTDVIGILNHHYNIAYGLTSVPVLATCGGPVISGSGCP
jgi:hypothetical protein